MVYHVNEDKPTNKATVHKSSCKHAQKRTKLTRNGRWYEYLNSRDEAVEVAHSTGRRDIKEAGCVNPN